MIQFCVWIIYDQITGFSQFHTEINVIKCNCKFFCKPSDFVKSFALHHHTCSSNCTVILCTDDSVAVACRSSRLQNKTMPCNSAETNDYTCVLNRIVLIIHSGTDSSNITAHTVAKQFFQTILINDFRIVIQQKEIFTFCKSSSIIIDCRIIELLIPVNHMGFWILCFQFFVILESSIICTVIFNNDIFIIFVSRFLINGIHTPFQIINMIFIRNNDGNQWIMVSVKSCPVEPQKLSLIYFCVNTRSSVVFFNRTLPGFKCISFALRIFRGGFLMTSPVIQDLRYMTDLFRADSLYTAENKVIILRSVKFLTESSDLFNNFSVNNK